jgi:hypothetical protein
MTDHARHEDHDCNTALPLAMTGIQLPNASSHWHTLIGLETRASECWPIHNHARCILSLVSPRHHVL